MPISVPIYQESVGDDAPSGARVADVNPGAFGGQVAGALGNVGQSIDQAASAADDIQAMHDQTAVTAFASDTSGQITNVLHGDGKTTLGYSALKGEDALNGRQAAVDQIQAIKSSAMDQAQNYRQQRLLLPIVTNMATDAFSKVADYAQQATVDYKNQVDAAAINQDGQNYVAAMTAGDAQQAQVYRTLMQVKRAQNLSFNGTPMIQADGTPNPIASMAMMGDATPVIAQVTDNLLSNGQIQQAHDFYIAHQGEMDGATRASVGAVVNERYGSLGAVNAVKAQAGLAGAEASQNHALNSALGVDTSAAPAGPVPAGAATARNLLVQAGASPTEADGLARTAMLESSGGKNLKNPLPGSTSAGYWGFTDATWNDLGGTAANRNDPATQAQTALKLYRQDQATLTSVLGRQPSSMEMHLAHQQGIGGAEALLKANQSAPTTLAVDVLTPVYGGDRARAMSAIANNGGQPTSTVAQFLSTWAGRVNGTAAAASTAMAPPTTPMTVSQPIADKAGFIAGVVSRAPPGASPQVIAQYQAAAENYVNQQHAAVDDANTQAWNAIQPLLRDDTITSYDQLLSRIPGPVMANLKQTQLTDLYKSYKNAGGPYAKQDDPQALQALHHAMDDNPAWFARLDMSQYTDKLTAESYSKMLDLQDGLKRGKDDAKQKVETVSNIMSTTGQLLKAAGYMPKGEGVQESTAQAQAIAHYQQAMTNWAELQTNTNGKPPTPQEIQQRATQLLTQQVQTRSASGGVVAGVNGPNTPFLMADPTKQNFVPIAQIPVPIQKQISAGYARRNGGKLPTSQQVENAYVDFKTRGIY